jgi:hypothetical protein
MGEDKLHRQKMAGQLPEKGAVARKACGNSIPVTLESSLNPLTMIMIVRQPEVDARQRHRHCQAMGADLALHAFKF